MRWKIRLLLFMLVFGAFAGTSAHAGARAHDFYFHPPQDFFFAPYIGAGLGAFNLSTNDDSDNVFGGYGVIGADLHRYFGLEVRVGTAADGAARGFTKVRMDWFVSYLAKFQLPATEYLRFYAVVGGTTLRSSLTRTSGVKVTDTKTGFTAGGGLDYRLLDNLLLAGEWTQYANKYDGFVKRGLDVWGATGLLKLEF